VSSLSLSLSAENDDSELEPKLSEFFIVTIVANIVDKLYPDDGALEVLKLIHAPKIVVSYKLFSGLKAVSFA
jgi:hypothetical protein